MAGLKLFDFTHNLLELSLRTRAARHEVLSANIANADTPGYRPKDLDFNAVMKSAVEAGVSGSAQDGNLLARASTEIESAVYEPEYPDDRHGEDRLDGNAVSLDRQMALMTENSLGYEASLTLLQRALAGLRYAIGEGRR
ncbi:MAG TPA: flagellar basal body rod protein FlgB [Terriglobales bacterium]|jgi:flagellar basal-body rod protein FlgB|nr:flagellar basal body rod protein FlgB [Terriglobales bacterium]